MKQQISTPEDLLKIVCDVLEQPLYKIKSLSRKGDYVIVRHIYCYIAKEYYGFKLKRIGNSLGGRDHTTALNSINFVINKIDIGDTLTNDFLNEVLDKLDLTVNDKKTYENIHRLYTTLLNNHKLLCEELAALKQNKTYQDAKIKVLNNQIKLYKTNALVV